jgi:hypothetical protein
MRLPTKCASGVPFAIDSILHRRSIPAPPTTRHLCLADPTEFCTMFNRFLV